MFASVKDALKKLQSQPTDPQANLEVGKYRCFVNGDWESGLTMLALGSDKALQKLAEMELAGASTATEQVSLGDSWWELSGKVDDGTQAIQRRAASWYLKALPRLAGLSKLRVVKRLDEVTDADSPATTATNSDGSGSSFVSLFDGNTLDGWEGDDNWKVADGVIVGECPARAGGGSFLASQKQYRNFVLRLKFKLYYGNSGIFIRNYRCSDGGIANLQVEIGYTPRLRMNNGRDFMTGAVNAEVKGLGPDSFVADMPEALKPKVLTSIRNNEWSECVITAHDDGIAVEINGHRTVDVHNPKVEREGVIRLQLHGGGTKIAFKDLYVKELPD